MKHLLFFILISFATCCFSDEIPELKIKSIADGVYLHTSYKVVQPWGLVGSNGLVVIDHKNAFIIDTPWSETDTEKLIDWIKQQGFTLKASLSTHFHSDRTAGISTLNAKSIPTYASTLTNQLLKDKNEPQATHTFDKNSFWLLKNSIEVYFPGAAHTRDNLVVWLPKQKILFGGCMIRSGEATDMGNTADGDIKTWANSVEKVRKKYKHAKIVVPGHGGIGDVTMLEHTSVMAKAANK